MPTNNDFLSDIADEPRKSGKTNNQLLEIIAESGGGSGSGVSSVNGQTGVVNINASDVPYDNTGRQIATSNDVQGSIDNIDNALFQEIEDRSAEDSLKVNKSGDTMTGSLGIASTYPSDDVPGGIDGTKRLNLHSFQRAHTNTYGETIRHFLMRKDAKAMEAYYIPKLGYNADRTPIADLNEDGTPADISQWQPISWTGSHYEANDRNSNHVHWELEIPDSTGALQGRLEVPFANPTTGVVGLDKTFIRTNLCDFVVRTSNNQAFRLSSPSGNHKPIEFNHDSEGSTAFRRWIIRANSTAESGSNNGTDFQLVRYDDTGNLLDSPIFVKRSTGYLGLGTITTIARISITAATTAAGGIAFGSDTNLYRSGVNELKTDGKFSSGGLVLGYRAVTAATTANLTDHTINATTGTFNVTLPTALGIAGQEFEIINTGNGVITVATTSSQNINGSTTYALSTQYKFVLVRSTGSGWIVVGNN